MVQSKQRFNIEIGIFVTKLDVCFVAMLYLNMLGMMIYMKR